MREWKPVMMNAGTSEFPDGCRYAKESVDAAFLIFDGMWHLILLKKKMGRRLWKADPDYYHEGQTGRIFYYSCVSASRYKISPEIRSVRFPLLYTV